MTFRRRCVGNFFIDDKTFCVVPVNHPEAAQFSQIRENASWPRFYAKATRWTVDIKR